MSQKIHAPNLGVLLRANVLENLPDVPPPPATDKWQ
jgi:hypothetical protein